MDYTTLLLSGDSESLGNEYLRSRAVSGFSLALHHIGVMSNL